MGNKSTRPRELIEERYTHPQGSFEYKDGDYRKLRRLILNGQLAPCYPGAEEYTPELDECPICFLFYPSLNRSSCCSKSVCTECYLQIKSSGYAPFTNCPFCKTSNYIVNYRGAKTAEEKDFEQAEEQKVIEAKIRIHQKELQDEEDRLLRRGEDRLAEEGDLVSTREHALHAHDYDIQHLNQHQDPFEHDEIQLFGQHGFEEECCQQESFCHSSGDDETGLDMEEVMLMKAIWLSIQEQGYRSQDSALAQQTFHNNAMKEFGLRRRKGRRCSGSGNLAEVRGERVASGSGSFLERANFTHVTPINSGDFHTRSSTIEIPQNCSGGLLEDEEAAWGKFQARNFYSHMQRGSYEEMDGLSSATASIVPESYDEQLILAMALSLADEEARAR